MSKIAVIGVGYVGLVTCVGLAKIGHQIIGTDINAEKINLLKQKIMPIYEPQIEELLRQNNERITFSTNIEKTIKQSQIIYICVDTPESENGEVELKNIYQVADLISKNIEKNTYVIIKSTVKIGTCEIIEQYINKNIKNKAKIEVISNPEFLSQGTAVNDFINAQRIVIGISSTQAELLMKEIYREFNVPYIITNTRSSEMIKYVANSFLALKISYMNEIANLCEKVDADIESVEKGIGTDKRIGNLFLKAGIGYGGSCLVKDTKALICFANQQGEDLKTIQATIDTNQKQVFALLNKSKKYYKNLKNKKVAILGATFKPNTDDIRKAPSICNIDKMLKENAKITIYDTKGKQNLKKKYGNKLEYKDSIEETLQNADICFIFTELNEIKQINPNIFEKKMKVPIILDGRNCFSLESMKDKNVIYESIGRKSINNMLKECINIIMPVYNCANFLSQTIESIKKQTYSNWNLIIIDDCSTDNGLEIIKENIKDIQEKVKVIHLMENSGVANARNIGLKEAKGNYIAYIDADDIWEEDKLEKQLSFMKQNDYGFTFTSYVYLRENKYKQVKKIVPKLNYKDSLKNTIILTSTVMINTKKIPKNLLQMPNVRRGQDTATWWQILKQGYTAYGLHEPLTIYRRRKNALSSKKLTALKRTWNLYRNIEKMSALKSSYYFLFYAWNAVKRRIA